jgi:hypothetical protein
LTWEDRIQMGVEQVGLILRKLWPYLLVCIALGAAIHGWAQQDFFTRYAGAANPFAVLIAVLIGIALYSNAAGIMPLVQALHDKGMPMGTPLASSWPWSRSSCRAHPAAPRPEAPTHHRVRGHHRRRDHRRGLLFSAVLARSPPQQHHLPPKEAIAMIIKILGSGCANSVNLERVTRKAVADLGINARSRRSPSTGQSRRTATCPPPRLVVDEEVVLAGRVTHSRHGARATGVTDLLMDPTGSPYVPPIRAPRLVSVPSSS